MSIKVQSKGQVLELESGASGFALAKKLKKDLPGSPLALCFYNPKPPLHTTIDKNAKPSITSDKASIGTTIHNSHAQTETSSYQLRDLSTQLQDGDRVEVLTFADVEGKKVFWHSSAHLLAQAVLRLFPQAKPSIGPAIEEGFFYDFGDLQLNEGDLEKIEAKVQEVIKERLSPERIEFANEEEANKAFAQNRFKLELIKGREETLSAYRQADFLDLCTGPHLPNFSLVQGFKLLKVSGAYWRGDSKNEQLTRIYGISFPEKKMLSAYLHRLEEARKRDHRVLGSRLNLFSFHAEGPGMTFFHPKGMIIWNQLLAFMSEIQIKYDYSEIKTPTMLSHELWERSGHWENYRENIYTSEVDERQFVIKPMNCPGCLLYYKNGQYSYRQLPLRIAEIGHVHRHEMSGALSGLFRVRSFHQDDAHIFMRPEDIESEVLAVLALADEVYRAFGLEYHLELSTRPQKSIGTDEQWKLGVQGLSLALEASKRDFVINEGDGAFYGPKIDFHIRDALGRTWQCGTIQLDMSLPERFDLLYDTATGGKQRPIMIHRAIYGSVERFLAILLEHYAGRFPLWLSPVQLRLLTVADRHIEFAKKLQQELRQAASFRMDIDTSTESVSKKVRKAQMEQVNYMLVLGDQEMKSDTLTIRSREGKVWSAKTKKELMKTLQEENDKRSLHSLFA